MLYHIFPNIIFFLPSGLKLCGQLTMQSNLWHHESAYIFPFVELLFLKRLKQSKPRLGTNIRTQTTTKKIRLNIRLLIQCIYWGYWKWVGWFMVIETTFPESPVQLLGSSDKESSPPQQVVRSYRAWRRRIQSHKFVNVNSTKLWGSVFFLNEGIFLTISYIYYFR